MLTHAISRVQSDSVFKDRGEEFPPERAAEPSPGFRVCQRDSGIFFRGLGLLIRVVSPGIAGDVRGGPFSLPLACRRWRAEPRRFVR